MKGDNRQTAARIRACQDLRNFISHAVTTLYIFGADSSNAVDPANIWSLDELAVTLNKVGIAAPVTTTPATQKVMRKKKTSVKNPKQSSSFQAKADLAKLTITLAISPTGAVPAAVYAIREGDFKLKTGKKAKPWKFQNFSIQVCSQCSPSCVWRCCCQSQTLRTAAPHRKTLTYRIAWCRVPRYAS